jgi:hypothetical protein
MDYPYYGYFYTIGIDENKPLDEREEEKIVVFETPCDIAESSHTWSNTFISAKYAVYFPYDKYNETIQVKNGYLFEADVNGLTVDGKVVGVFPSQLGGITVYIQDMDS